jgi:hypothetical protein
MNYNINSTSWMHTPGIMRWIMESVKPFDPSKAVEFLESMGLPAEVAADLASKSPKHTLVYEDFSVLVKAPESSSSSLSTDTGGIAP